MDNTLQFIDNSRVFINPAVGCSSRCAFCYIGSLGFSNLVPSTVSGADIKALLLENQQFVLGLNGTIISISPDTEPFDDKVVSISLDYISSMSKLGNPMQVSTRRQLDKTLIKQIVNSLAYPNQLTLFVSSISITYHDKFEQKTTIPAKRFETFGACQSEGLPVCLYIKPVIPNITIIDKDEYVRVINHYSVPFCCVGEFYVDPSILSHVNSVLRSINAPEIKDGPGKYNSPFTNELHQITDLNSEDNLSSSVLELEQYIKDKTSTKVHRTSTCVMSNSLNIPSAERKWITYPHLCVQCQDCDGMAKKIASPIFNNL